jgi:hypothetical protein
MPGPEKLARQEFARAMASWQLDKLGGMHMAFLVLKYRKAGGAAIDFEKKLVSFFFLQGK